MAMLISYQAQASFNYVSDLCVGASLLGAHVISKENEPSKEITVVSCPSSPGPCSQPHASSTAASATLIPPAPRKRCANKKKAPVDEEIDQLLTNANNECSLFWQIVAGKLALCLKHFRTDLQIQVLEVLKCYEQCK